MPHAAQKRNDLEARIDALGQALARTDPATRKAMLGRLERVLDESLRPRAVTPHAAEADDEAVEDETERRFDNLPI
ncbi:hypothetical protein ROJ8625_02130 [Roseivivax jejudonensis]|uniref:Uncharacterized protein n=1 Tax=Roseivivax jejudonensis TaxID=1529041 RepID=A0A1X6Z7R9_9RHOB|nr:hypothetical protein [Roseivivax jejudonensis]SLN43111.1 hypothetical protein ROJ8625_02130 [Roseivivax jejudonensis]